MAQDIKTKKQKSQEEEVVETVEKQLLRSLSWTWQMNVRMSSKTNTFALMQKCRIFNAVPMKSVKTCTTVSQPGLGKRFSHHRTTLERALTVEGLTDDVKKGLEMVQERDSRFEEEGIEEIVADEGLTITTIWPSNSPSRR